MYSEPCQTYEMEHCAKIVDGIQLLTIFPKGSLLYVAQCDEYASDNTT